MRPFVENVGLNFDGYVLCYPNAGLPDNLVDISFFHLKELVQLSEQLSLHISVYVVAFTIRQVTFISFSCEIDITHR